MADSYGREGFSFEMLTSLFESTKGEDYNSASYSLLFQNVFRVFQDSIVVVQGLRKISLFLESGEM